MRHIGTADDLEKTRILRALKKALGIGSKRHDEEGAVAGSRRGEITLLDQDLAKQVDADYAVIITSHDVSAKGELQIVIPLGLPAADGWEDDQEVASYADYTRLIGADKRGARWTVPYLLTVDQRQFALARTAHLIESSELTSIEEVLVRRFQFDKYCP